MPWNLFIFPLAAGYLLLTRCHYLKPYQQRLDRQRLIFESILYGALMFGIAFFIRLLIEYCFPGFLIKVSDSFPLKTTYTLTSISTVFIALGISEISNRWIFDYKKCVARAIDDVGNEFELLLKSSFIERELLLFSLDNDKFYIGWVKELPIPSVSNYVRIFPALSGYRDARKELIFKSHYLTVYSEYVKEGKVHSIHELNTDVVIDYNKIITISFFDLEMYTRFNQKATV